MKDTVELIQRREVEPLKSRVEVLEEICRPKIVEPQVQVHEELPEQQHLKLLSEM